MMAKASEPMPLLQGSRTVRLMAVARMASTALPPFRSMRRPACAARGWEVATMLLAKMGTRREGYGWVQVKGMVTSRVVPVDLAILHEPQIGTKMSNDE